MVVPYIDLPSFLLASLKAVERVVFFVHSDIVRTRDSYGNDL